MGTSSRIVLLAGFVAAVVVVMFPPYQDENGHSRGHSLIGSPPPPPKWMTEPDPFGPIVMPDGTVVSQPALRPPLPSHIDWALLVRSELVVALGAWALIAIQRMRIATWLKRIPTACILAVALPPIPFVIAPLAMLPTEMYTDSNHGIPAVVLLGVLGGAYAFCLYVLMTGWTAIRRRLFHRSTAVLALVLAATAATSGCSYPEQFFIVNSSSAPLAVTATATVYNRTDNGERVCSWSWGQPGQRTRLLWVVPANRVRNNYVPYDQLKEDTSATFDEASCSIRVDIGPGLALLLWETSNGRRSEFLTRISMGDSGQRVIEGPEVWKQFKRLSSAVYVIGYEKR